MELYLDTVLPAEIKAAAEYGFLTGVTTTPTFMQRQGVTDVDKAIVELSHLVPLLHVEALGDTWQEIIAEAERQANLPGVNNNLVFKIPITNEGLKAVSRLSAKGYRTNVHLVYTLNQAWLAAAAGATYICPLVGRLHDQGHDSFALIQQIVDMVNYYGYNSKVMVSSVRHADHVRMAVVSGAQAVTIPWKVLKVLTDNSLTEKGIFSFEVDTKLTTYTVKQIMGAANPVVTQNTTVGEAARIMTETGLGIVSVADDNGLLSGVFTDGDLRRHVSKPDLALTPMSEMMGRNPKFLTADTILQDAVKLFREVEVDNFVVVDEHKKPIGILDVQDLVREGLLQ